MQHPDRTFSKSEKTLSDKVGEMAEESQAETRSQQGEPTSSAQGTVLRDRMADEAPNPKKRMWEEPIDRPQEERQRDEL